MNIFLASSDPARRATLSAICIQTPDARVVGSADHGQALLSEVFRVRPDLLLVDWELPFLQRAEPSQAGAGLIEALCAGNHRMRIIVFSADPEAERLALAAGANGFFSIRMTPAQVSDTLRERKPIQHVPMASQPLSKAMIR